jgi:hypothetical protein
MAAEVQTIDSILERVRRDGVRKAAVALRRPPVSSRLLQELLALEDCPEARLFVAAYPLSQGQLLETLAGGTEDPEILGLLATNPRTPPHLLSKLATHAEPSVRAQVAQHPQLPPREMPNLAEDADPLVRRALAGNPELRLPVQAMLAFDSDPSVRLALAGLSTLGPQAALVLGSESSAVVRVHTVATAHAEEDLLRSWAASDEEELQLALTGREDLSPKLRGLLLRSPHASVRRLAREGWKLDEVDLFGLVSSPAIEDRAWVASRSLLPRPLQRLLAQDADSTVRIALAGNASLDTDVAGYFVSQADEAVCEALAGNPSLPVDLVRELAAQGQPRILTVLAYRDDLESVLPPVLAAHSEEFCSHWAIQGKPLSGLEEGVARRLLQHPLPEVRALGVSGHSWRRADLYDFARSPLRLLRLAALRHPNAPDELVSDLCRDADTEIAELANSLLQQRREQALRRPNVSARPEPASPRASTRAQETPQGLSHDPLSGDSDAGLISKLKRLFFR